MSLDGVIARHLAREAEESGQATVHLGGYTDWWVTVADTPIFDRLFADWWVNDKILVVQNLGQTPLTLEQVQFLRVGMRNWSSGRASS